MYDCSPTLNPCWTILHLPRLVTRMWKFQCSSDLVPGCSPKVNISTSYWCATGQNKCSVISMQLSVVQRHGLAVFMTTWRLSRTGTSHVAFYPQYISVTASLPSPRAYSGKFSNVEVNGSHGEAGGMWMSPSCWNGAYEHAGSRSSKVLMINSTLIFHF